jgi:MFS family permease
MTPNKLWTPNFILITFTNLFVSAASFLLIPVLPIFAKQILKADEAQIGLIISIYTLSALILRPFVGWGLDALGRKLIYFLGLSFFALLMPWHAWLNSISSLLILRFLHGFSWGIVTTGGSTIASDLVPPSRRGEGIGYFGMSFTIAMALGPVIGLAMLKKVDFQTLFYTASALVGLAFLLANLIKYPVIQINHSHNQLTFNTLFDKRGLPASWVALICSGVYGGLITFMTLFTEEKKIKSGLEMLDSGALFFVAYAIGLTLVRPFAGKELDKNGPRKVIGGGLSVLIIGILILTASSEIYQFLLGAFIAGIGMGSILPTTLTMVVNLVEPERRGVANSTFFSMVDIGVSCGTMLLGWVASISSISIMFYLCAGLIVLPLILFFSYVLNDYQTKVLQNQ